MVAYPGLNVKLIGTHADLSGEDGVTHQCLMRITDEEHPGDGGHLPGGRK